MRKKHVYVLGSCVAEDVAFAYTPLFEQYGYEIFDSHHDQKLSSKFSTLLDKPGPMAQRLYEDMHLMISDKMKLSAYANRLPIHTLTWLQYEAVVKTIDINTVYRDVGPDDILLIDFHGELYSEYNDGLDSFQIHPMWHEIQKFMPPWFVDKVNSFPTYQADMLSIIQAKRRNEKAIAFLRRLEKIFNNRVIVIGNVFTNKICMPGNIIAQQLEFDHMNISIPFITVDSHGQENHINMPFINRVYDNFYRGVKKFCPDWNFVTPARDQCYSDPNHRWGLHPCHLHPLSMGHLRQQLEESLTDLTSTRLILDQAI